MTPLKYKDAGLAMLAARRFYITGHDLDDLFQEACYAIVKAEPGWQPSKGARSTYLYRAAHSHISTLLDASRAAKRTCPTGEVLSLNAESDLIEDQELIDTIEAIGDLEGLVEQRDLIQRALAHPRLTPGERACVTAFAIGCSNRDAGYSRDTGDAARRKLRNDGVTA